MRALLIACALLMLTAAAEAPRVATVDGHRMSYFVLGSKGAPIVFLSGWGDDHRPFLEVATDLARDNTAILYDRPGYGGSEPTDRPRDVDTAAAELHALLAQSGVPGPYVLVGHSLGGQYAEAFAARYPGETRALILDEARPGDFYRACMAATPPRCSTPQEVIERSPPYMRAEVGREIADVNEAALGRLKPRPGLPVLVIVRGASPNDTPVYPVWRAAQERQAARYGGRLVVVEGAGHYVHRDKPEAFLAAVRAFLAGLRGR